MCLCKRCGRVFNATGVGREVICVWCDKSYSGASRRKRILEGKEIDPCKNIEEVMI